MKQLLKLDSIRKHLPFKTQETTLIDHLSHFLEYGDKFDFDVYLPSKGKNLQREFCWTVEQKAELILSILKGIKIANLYVIQKKIYSVKNGTPETIYQIIDGKQRLSTIIDFVQGKFPIEFNNEEYYFNDLSVPAQNEIEYGVPNVWIAYEYIYSDNEDNVIISDDDKIAWFEMINFAGTSQDKEHLNNLKS